RGARCFRIAHVVDEVFRQPDRLGEGCPEFRLKRAACGELAILGRVNLVPWRATHQPHFSWLWVPSCGGTQRKRRRRKRNHVVGHCDTDTTALSVLIA